MFRNFKVLLAVLAVLVIMGGAYAFAASNTVPATKDGDGLGAVSGYTASNIAYTLNGTAPSTIDSVAFTLNAAAATGKVKIKLDESTTTWYGCVDADTGRINWICDTTDPAITATDIDQLQVVAASD